MLQTGARQAPLFMGFSRQEYFHGLPYPPPGDLPDSGIKPASLMSPALEAGLLPLVPPGKPSLGEVFMHKCIGIGRENLQHINTEIICFPH